MPGATLTIERNVEVHVWPNVRILVLGNLVADGTLWQPIRFKPINSTELAESLGRIGTAYRRRRRRTSFTETPSRNRRTRRINLHADLDARFLEWHRNRRDQDGAVRRISTVPDESFRSFPELVREHPRFQCLSIRLLENGTERQRAGFLHFYNATTGEIVPSCDAFFTLRNAQVVCR